MREIKFRAWDKEIQQIIEVETIHWNIKYAYYTDSKGECQRVCFDYLMQYTGLKDAEGVEIYEGDIVKGNFRINIEGKVNLTKAEIKYYRGCFWLCWIEDTGKKPLHELEYTILGETRIPKIEVIGNIYKNKELLK